MDQAQADALRADWALHAQWRDAHGHRGVLLDGDFAPEDEAEQWAEELVGNALAAMADAGVEVSRGPVRLEAGKVLIAIDGLDMVARDLDHGSASLGIEVILARLDGIAADRGSRARWHFWYEGDPVGTGFFVEPQDFATSTGVDVRELGVGGRWYRPDPRYR